jgi:hypothetical protein
MLQQEVCALGTDALPFCRPANAAVFPSPSPLVMAQEEYIRRICEDIIKHRPDLVITEKGVSGCATVATLAPVAGGLQPMPLLACAPVPRSRTAFSHAQQHLGPAPRAQDR